MNDLNRVIKSNDPKKPLISFSDKTPAQQLFEITRFIKALDHFKFRIYIYSFTDVKIIN
jgi:hypothetical protein